MAAEFSTMKEENQSVDSQKQAEEKPVDSEQTEQGKVEEKPATDNDNKEKENSKEPSDPVETEVWRKRYKLCTSEVDPVMPL